MWCAEKGFQEFLHTIIQPVYTYIHMQLSHNARWLCLCVSCKLCDL